jgi:hypothetical protein
MDGGFGDRLRVVQCLRFGGVMANPTSGKSDADIIWEVRQMYHSPLMVHIREAHKRGVPASVKIGSYTIQYEPYQFSGMTAFPDGFVVGKEAFASEDEFKKTLLHETYRLCRSEIGQGHEAHKGNIMAETNAAFHFAERNWELI